MARAEGEQPKTAQELLARIDARGDIYFAEAAADLAAAEARLAGARAALFPSFNSSYEGERYDPTVSTDRTRAEVIGTVEVVQRIYDFGQTSSRIDAAEADLDAARLRNGHARNVVLMEAMALYHDLHASDLTAQALEQDHASAYVQWERAQERHKLGKVSPVEVAEKLAAVEQSRLVLHREQRRNMDLRLRLSDLSGAPFSGTMLDPPLGPEARPAEVDGKVFEDAVVDRNPELRAMRRKADGMRLARDGTVNRPVIETYGALNYYSRPSGTRDDWAAGARIKWPFYDGGLRDAERSRQTAELARAEARLELARRDLTRRARVTLRERDNAWQQLVAARARHDFARKYLLQRQRLYEQERVTDLGRAMINFTEAEADVVRAAGNLNQVNAQLAVMLGQGPAQGLEENFILRALGDQGKGAAGSYETKKGSGFGQDDQNEIKR